MKVVIEANIGSGKSTILNLIQQDLRIPVFPEPVNDWSLLGKYYENNERWGFTFNLEVLLSFNKWKNNGFDAIYERSPSSCRHVFFDMLIDDGKVLPEEVTIFDKLHQNLAWKSDAVIYIKTDPKICMDRMLQRGRECERGVTLEYLEKVHRKHEAMIEKADDWHVVDGNKSISEVYQDVKTILRNLKITNL